MKRNVLQLVGSFHQGGSERQAVQLTRLLKQDGSVNVFIAALSGEGVLRDEIEELGLRPVPEFPLTSFYDANFIRQVRKCARFIRENRIGVVHTHDFYTNVFGMAAAKLARVPRRIASKRETGGMRSAGQKALEKVAFRAAHAIVANSSAVKRYLVAEGVPEEKIAVVFNGLDLKRLSPQETDRARVCAMFGLPADDGIRFITLVANLRHEVKNQPMLLRAAKTVVAGFPDAHFVIAGEGELLGGLEKLADSLGITANVHFLGRCARVPELLSVSFACVLTSFHEGFSNSILEYMAAGKPVVATDVGGAIEAVVENETGFLVASDDDQALADRLARLLADEEMASRLGAKGREDVAEKFSCTAQLASTLGLYGFIPDGK